MSIRMLLRHRRAKSYAIAIWLIVAGIFSALTYTQIIPANAVTYIPVIAAAFMLAAILNQR